MPKSTARGPLRGVHSQAVGFREIPERRAVPTSSRSNRHPERFDLSSEPNLRKLDAADAPRASRR